MNPEIEKRLKELALSDWDEFLRVSGIDTTNSIICLERKKGKSWGQISTIVNLSKGAVRNRYKACIECAKK